MLHGRTATIIAIAALALTLTACKGGGTTAGNMQTDNVGACTDVYGDGAVFATEDELASTFCDPGDGTQLLPGSAFSPCEDGRVMYWNDQGWGYLGEPFAPHGPGPTHATPDRTHVLLTA